MNNKNKRYRENVLDFLEYKHSREKINIELEEFIKVVINNPELLKKAESEWREHNKKRKEDQASIMLHRNKTDKAKKRSTVQGNKNIENGTYGTTELALKGVDSQIKSGSNLFLSPEMEHIRLKGSRNALKVQKEKGLGFYDPVNRQKGVDAGNAPMTCKYCGLTSNLRNIKKSHQEKCQNKPEDIKKILKLLPNVFHNNEWFNAFKTTGINYTKKAQYTLLSKGHVNKVQTAIYCKKGYKPSKKEIEIVIEQNPSKATRDKLEKVNKLKSLLSGEFTGKTIAKVGEKVGLGNSFCRGLLRDMQWCIQTHEGPPGSSKNVSRYTWI